VSRSSATVGSRTQKQSLNREPAEAAPRSCCGQIGFALDRPFVRIDWVPTAKPAPVPPPAVAFSARCAAHRAEPWQPASCPRLDGTPRRSIRPASIFELPGKSQRKLPVRQAAKWRMPRVRQGGRWRLLRSVLGPLRTRQWWRRQHLRMRWLGNVCVSFSMDLPISLQSGYFALDIMNLTGALGVLRWNSKV
jgi:hypothetical protein